MSATARLLLVRHGQTVWHRENRYAGGGSDIELTATGVAQAADLATWAKDANPTAVVSSPVRRALETARPSADALGLEVQVVPDLREVSFGIAEGRTMAELLESDPDVARAFQADPVRYPFPGAEPPDHAAARAAAALRRTATAHHHGTVLVVAHNTLLRLALCELLGIGVHRYRQVFPRLDNAAVTELLVPVDPAQSCSLISLNVPVTCP